MTQTDPVAEHLCSDSPENGQEAIRLAKEHDVFLSFDLLRLTPSEARLVVLLSVECKVFERWM
jgi:hypothetical protein